MDEDVRAMGGWIDRAEIRPQIWQSNNRRWAAPQHYTCSYMAMFPPQLPHYFIRRFTQPGDTILDPFSGRGTTPVEAMAQGRIGIGNDFNELAYVLTKGKLANPTLKNVEARLDSLQSNFCRKDWMFNGANMKAIPSKIKMIYHPETLRQLMYLKRELDWMNNDVDAFLTMILMGAMHGSSSGFLSLSMPNTFSMSPTYVKKYIADKGLKRPLRNAFDVMRVRCIRTLKLGQLPGGGRAILGDVRRLDNCGIPHGSVKMIFSSPPYLKVIKYGQYNWIRLWWLMGGHQEVDEKLDDTHSLNPYEEFIHETLQTTLPLLDEKKGLACWVIGDVNDRNLALHIWDEVASKIQIINSEGEPVSYRLLGIVQDDIPESEKVTKMWKTKTTKTIIFERTEVSITNLSGVVEEDIAQSMIEKWSEKFTQSRMEGVERESQFDNEKTGKATPKDRILIMCPTTCDDPEIFESNDIQWEPLLHSDLN
jgi:site-specific DNA-methyltransferase (adenine-specific)